MTPSRLPRRGRDFSQELAGGGWYHSFELPDGSRFEGHNTLEILNRRYARFPLPGDLRGKRVLDVGAWDGWFSFEAERHGAEVTAIDCVELPNFLQSIGHSSQRSTTASSTSTNFPEQNSGPSISFFSLAFSTT